MMHQGLWVITLISIISKFWERNFLPILNFDLILKAYMASVCARFRFGNTTDKERLIFKYTNQTSFLTTDITNFVRDWMPKKLVCYCCKWSYFRARIFIQKYRISGFFHGKKILFDSSRKPIPKKSRIQIWTH